MCLISLIAFLSVLFRTFQYNHGSLSTLHTVIYDPFSLYVLAEGFLTQFSPLSQPSEAALCQVELFPGRGALTGVSLHSATQHDPLFGFLCSGAAQTPGL